MNTLKSTSIEGYVIFNKEDENYWSCLANTFVNDISKATIFTSKEDVLNTFDEIVDDDKAIIRQIVISIGAFDCSYQLKMEKEK